MAQPPKVLLSDLVRRICASAQLDLEELSLKLANVDDGSRKKVLQAYCKHIRHRFIKLLVAIKWCVTSSNLVEGCLLLSEEYSKNEVRIFETVQALRRSASVLHILRAPIHDIVTSSDVLGTGTYLRLPRKIAQIANDELDDRLPEMDQKEILRKLEQFILDRLLRAKVPAQYTNLLVAGGTLVCTVADEFEVTLTLSGASLDSPWRVVKLEVFVSGESSEFEHRGRKRQKRGVFAFFDSKVLTEDAEDDADDKTEENGKRKKPSKARDASSAFRPKKYAVFYLLKILQQRLLKSEKPLVDAYEIVHSFCASLCVKTLEAQAKELTENHWKAGALHVSSPQPNTLELRHWGEACLLKIAYDPNQRDGQLFVELDPPVDTSSCRPEIVTALSKAPPPRRKRQLVVEGAKDTGDGEAKDVEEQDNVFVKGLCPSALNVENVLLLGALAHAEGRLNQLGLALDAFLFDAETSSSTLGSPPQLFSEIQHPISIQPEENQVGLHVGLAVSRYLKVTVEMRTGEFIVSLFRRNTTDSTMGGHQSSRRWGSSTDVMLLITAEKSLNNAMKTHGIKAAAKELHKLLLTLSELAVLESLELAAEQLQLPFQRSNPFTPTPEDAASAKTNSALTSSQRSFASTPIVFARIWQWDNFEYFLGMCRRGTSQGLFHKTTTATPQTGKTEGSTTNQLDWFVVAGPAQHQVCVDPSRLVLSKPFEGITETVHSDLSVKAMLERALDRARPVALSMSVERFMGHFGGSPELIRGNQIIKVTVDKPEVFGIVACTFGTPTCVTCEIEADMSRAVTIVVSPPSGYKKLQHVNPKAIPGVEFALVDLVHPVDAAEGGYFKLSFHPTLSCEVVATNVDNSTAQPKVSTPGAKDATNVPLGPTNDVPMPSTESKTGPVTKPGVHYERFSDIPRLNNDLAAICKMEIVCRMLLESREEGSEDKIVFQPGVDTPSVKILHTSLVCIVLECSNADMALKVAIGIDPASGDKRDFLLKILSFVQTADGDQSVPLAITDTLPWHSEIVKLLNMHIPSALTHIDWDFMKQVVRQVSASICYGLPVLHVMQHLLAPHPEYILNSRVKKPAEEAPPTPGGSKGRSAGGKLNWTKFIQAQKSASEKGARGVSVLAVSHLKLRVFVGEIYQIDLEFLLDGIRLLGDSKYVNEVVPSGTVLKHDELPSKLKECIDVLLEHT